MSSFSSNMNILYLCHRIPYPPDKGDKIRSYNHIKYLSQHHAIYLACLIDDPEDWRYVDPLRSMCRRVEVVGRKGFWEWWRIGKALLVGQPLSLGAFFVSALQEKVNVILERESIDRIVIFSSPMAEYVKHVFSIPKIIDFVDMDSEKWRAYAQIKSFPLSLLYGIEADRLGQYELEMATTCQQSLVISQEETHVLRERSRQRVRPKVIPNGVDSEYFSLASDVQRKKSIIVFTAAMDYFPNIDGAIYFCQKILPRIHQAIPHVQFLIVGRNPVVALRRMAERIPQVQVTGTVPDVRPYLSKAMVAVAPLRIARGVQNKILEAMAMELPVVGTTSAFQGLAVATAHGMHVADDPGAFADAVVRLLDNPELARACGLSARQFVTSHYDWSNILQEFEHILEGVTV
ncbi:MAG: TIGR03087 family PEP-CTERM/XrtA system glycosyltransferase [Nitrospirales bacterium]|nr:TIGR03087 family PEP-CTERM/XrtA system glycosyltransferase [Nitrospirales bacterium]